MLELNQPSSVVEAALGEEAALKVQELNQPCFLLEAAMGEGRLVSTVSFRLACRIAVSRSRLVCRIACRIPDIL